MFALKSSCMFFSLFLSIDLMLHLLYYVHSQLVSCFVAQCFEYVFVLKSACNSSLFLSIADQIFNSSYCVHSKLVSCCLIP